MNIRQTIPAPRGTTPSLPRSQTSDIVHDQQFDLNTASLHESAHKPLQSGNQSGFVEQGRVEQIR